MINGAYTSRKFSGYFKSGATPDDGGAPAIINGSAQAEKIADITRRFDELLVISLA